MKKALMERVTVRKHTERRINAESSLCSIIVKTTPEL